MLKVQNVRKKKADNAGDETRSRGTANLRPGPLRFDPWSSEMAVVIDLGYRGHLREGVSLRKRSTIFRRALAISGSFWTI